MDGKSFLGTARFLHGSGGDEAAYRSAVNRAYYACFLVVREVVHANTDAAELRKEGWGRIKGIRHEKLAMYLKGTIPNTVRGVGEDLSTLLGNRSDADYDMSGVVSAEDAEFAIESAKILLQNVANLKPAEVGGAMTAYLRSIHL